MTETQHTDRRASSGPDLNYGEAILRRLEELRHSGGNGNGGRATDPTLNVKETLDAAVRRLDDIRENDRLWQDKLDRERDRNEARIERYEVKIDRANEKAAVAEKERLDALRAEDKANIALALARGELEAKVLVTQVDTTAKALAAAGGRTTGMGTILAAAGTVALIVIAALALILSNLPRAVPT